MLRLYLYYADAFSRCLNLHASPQAPRMVSGVQSSSVDLAPVQRGSCAQAPPPYVY
jgi:hypothetical protein